MNNTADMPRVIGLTDEDRLAIETFYRAFGESDPDLLDQAVTADWQHIRSRRIGGRAGRA